VRFKVVRHLAAHLHIPGRVTVITAADTDEVFPRGLGARRGNVRAQIETALSAAYDKPGKPPKLAPGTIVEDLRRRAFQMLSLTVTEDNRGAVDLYKRLGYTVERVFDAFVWEG